VAAIASSIPDTIFSVKDAQNNKFIDSFSNAYGSNIFDICIGLGLPVLVYSSIYGPINMNMPIERIGGWIGDYVLDGNLFIWSLLVLFFFTAIVSLIYYKGNLKLNTAFLVFFLYLSFIITLIIF
jgi:cation:H+ antiporter